MKLHLPKLLCVAVMSALFMPAMGDTLTSENVVTPEGKTDSFLNIGTGGSTHTWNGDLVVGDTKTTQGDVDKIGAFDTSWNFQTPNGKTLYTNNFNVTGNLTVQGSNGKIVLGGQNGSKYTGLQVGGTVTVDAGTLSATKIVANHLVVNGGTVSTNTSNCTSGNKYAGASNEKQSYIKSSLTLTDGSLSFGYTDNVQGIGTGAHRMTTFGSSSSFTMNQSGGSLKVYGDMDLRSGSTISQTDNAGLLSLRDTVYMGSSGTTTFTQSADSAKLVIGRLESETIKPTSWNQNPKQPQTDFVFNQSGNGLIHLAYGSNFAGASTISLKQSGDGTINIGGGHDTKLVGTLPSRGYALNNNNGTSDNYTDDYPEFEAINTTYNIDQTGAGTITVEENATIVADSVNVGKNAHLVVDGQLDIATGEDKNAKVFGTVSGTGTITVRSGVLENHGTISNTSSQAMFTADDIASLADTDALLITIAGGEFKNYGITDSSILVDGGTLTLDQGILADVTLNSGSIIVNTDSTTGTLTLNGGSIIFAEGATLTLTDGAELNLVDTIIEVQVSEETLAGIINGTSAPVTLFETEGVTTDLKGITVNFTDGTNDHTAKVDGTKDGTGVVIIPEPTTATLSLLALAALAARRRRK